MRFCQKREKWFEPGVADQRGPLSHDAMGVPPLRMDQSDGFEILVHLPAKKVEDAENSFTDSGGRSPFRVHSPAGTPDVFRGRRTGGSAGRSLKQFPHRGCPIDGQPTACSIGRSHPHTPTRTSAMVMVFVLESSSWLPAHRERLQPHFPRPTGRDGSSGLAAEQTLTASPGCALPKIRTGIRVAAAWIMMMPGSLTSATALPASARTIVRNIVGIRVAWAAFYYVA